MRPFAMARLTALVLLTACTTPAQRRAEERTALEKHAAQDINRICALAPAEREQELKKLEAQSGMVVYCGK